jgi:flagellum-specific peptidoglycan hydrolase FlgJ
LRLTLRILNAFVILAVAALLASVATATTSQTKSTKSTKSSSSSHKSSKSSKSAKTSSNKSKKKSAKATAHGQHTIDQERTLAIQQALVRDHYLSGEPTGKWDQDTKDALVRLQAENGWQTKVTPDSRALIKLGLGPDKKGLLNPDTAVMSSPHELGTQHETVPGGSSQP